MRDIVKTLKKLVPLQLRCRIKGYREWYSNRNFKPYVVKKNMEGVNFDFLIGDADGRDWYDSKSADTVCYEMQFLKEHLIEKDDVVIDCGAHHGCTAILFSNWVGKNGKVIAFEALPSNCEIIQNNINLNHIENIILERKAVGAEDGFVHFNNISNGSVNPTRNGVEVSMTCLDNYKQFKPSFLKIDVEGFELQVLKGALQIFATRPKFAIEIHTEQLARYGASVDDLFRLLEIENYILWIQWDDKKEPEVYDPKIPITTRVHLFGVPLTKNP